jgi:prepilin-type processing-associated H-X9-DG protein
LNRAQRQGEQIHCLANQHQLLLAWLLYAPDHDDMLCSPQRFTSDLLPYVQIREVFVCKSVEDRARRGSYAISDTMGGRDSRDGVTPFDKLHTVSRPVERLVFVDKQLGYSDCFWPVMREDERWMWRPWSWPPSAGLQSVTGRHNDGCNMSFADGHGEYTHWRDDRTVRWIKGLIAEPDEASVGNRDLEHLVTVLTH